jgi:hypothetical protein
MTMLERLAALLAAATLLPVAAPAREDDPEPPPPKVEAREIEVKTGLKIRGPFGDPVRVKTKEQLTAVLGNKQVEAAILAKVKLGREHLLIFSWAGSGMDQLTATKGKDGEIVFEHVYGETCDYVLHSRLFAVPARAKVTVKKQ